MERLSRPEREPGRGPLPPSSMHNWSDTVTQAEAPVPTREEEQQELSRLLALPEIARSTNLVRLLSFICEKYFEGKTDEIRESAIAVQALGRRKEGFDSQADPIVRVTARTLRKRLEAYYGHEGRGHAVHLVLPTGQYVPRFVRSGRAAEGSVPAPDAESAADASDPDMEPLAQRGGPRPPAPVVAPARSSRLPPLKHLAWVIAVIAVSAGSFWLGRRSAVREEPVSKTILVWGSPVWSDEFEGPRGAVPEPTLWAYDVGNNGGWGNKELEIYCAASSALPPCDPGNPNAFQDGDGNLVIRAIRTAGGQWTSARLKTEGLREVQYGRVEARMKLPVGAGLWSAFWMLGTDIARTGWPGSGSIDITEHVTQALGPSTIRSTIHGPGYAGVNGLSQDYTLPEGGRVDDAAYHTYGVIWSPRMLQFYVDGPANVSFVRTASDVPRDGRWVFDHPFFMILSLAVGGLWPGLPDATTPSPSQILVDYVRIYQPAPVPAPSLAAPPIRVASGQAGTTSIRLSGPIGAGRVYVACSGAPASATCSLNTSVVDFTTAGTDTAILTITTKSSGAAGRLVTPPGSYTITVTATSVSGETSRLSIPLTVS
jgi:beta-glucanase (GH16 family)